MQRILTRVALFLFLLLQACLSYGAGHPFITRWKGEAGKELRFPIVGTYNLVIKRASDGTVLKSEIAEIKFPEQAYTYTPVKTEDILLEAGPEGVRYMQMGLENLAFGSCEQLLFVEQFGDVVWRSLFQTFSNCTNMQFAKNIDVPNLKEVTTAEGTFLGCTRFNQSLAAWDVSKITTMAFMFSYCRSFNQPLNNWDVSNVKDMTSMFTGCFAFNQPLNAWNVGRVERMQGMFAHCESFNQPLEHWDVSSVVDMKAMFFACTAFNQSLDSWNVSSVKRMGGMFARCESFNQPLEHWDVSNVVEMIAMFEGCRIFNQPLGRWDVSNVVSMGYMFSGCSAFNQPLANWDVGRVKSMQNMFFNCHLFNQPLNNWNVSSVTTMSGLFAGCSSFNQPLNNWKVQNVVAMTGMFFECSSFNQVLKGWDVSNVEDMQLMFYRCSAFNQDIGSWGWKLKKCFALGIENSGISEENYSSTLQSWSESLNDMNKNFYLKAKNLKFNKLGRLARFVLMREADWIFVGDLYSDVAMQPRYIAFESDSVIMHKGEKRSLHLQNFGCGKNVQFCCKQENIKFNVIDENNLEIEAVMEGYAELQGYVLQNENQGALSTECKIVILSEKQEQRK